MPRPRARNRQSDLFSPECPKVPMAAAEQRTELLALMSALLAETLAADAVAAEASDEDHA